MSPFSCGIITMQLMRNILIHSFGKSCRKRRLFSVVSTVDTRERMNCKEVVTHGLQEKGRWPEEVIAAKYENTTSLCSLKVNSVTCCVHKEQTCVGSSISRVRLAAYLEPCRYGRQAFAVMQLFCKQQNRVQILGLPPPPEREARTLGRTHPMMSDVKSTIED